MARQALKGKATLILACLAFALCLLGCASAASSGSTAASASSQSSSPSGGSAESASSVAQPGVARPSTSGRLHVEGTQLVGEDGRPVQLRGASTHGLAWFPEYVNGELFGELGLWGANVVRLAMYTAESGGYCTDGDRAELRKLVDDGVRYAADNDLYVIIDWHILSDGDPSIHVEEAEGFFRDASSAYSGRDNVLYEICNEPNGSTTWADVKAYAERIIPVIRANDPQAVIIVGTPTWSQDVDAAAADRLADDNVMYALHFYAATHKDDLRARAAAALDAGLPLFVTEFGICDASGNGAIDEEQAGAWISLLDERGVSYVMWNLSNKAETSAAFKATCDKASGFEDGDLSESGMWFKHMLAGEIAADDGASGAARTVQDTAVPSAPDPVTEPAAGAIMHAGDSLEYSVKLRDSWVANGESSFLYDVVLLNNGEAVSSWEIEVPFSADVKVSDSWNGTFAVEDSTVRISNAEYNGTVASGSSIADIGFIVAGPADLHVVQSD